MRRQDMKGEDQTSDEDVASSRVENKIDFTFNDSAVKSALNCATVGESVSFNSVRETSAISGAVTKEKMNPKSSDKSPLFYLPDEDEQVINNVTDSSSNKTLVTNANSEFEILKSKSESNLTIAKPVDLFRRLFSKDATLASSKSTQELSSHANTKGESNEPLSETKFQKQKLKKMFSSDPSIFNSVNSENTEIPTESELPSNEYRHQKLSKASVKACHIFEEDYQSDSDRTSKTSDSTYDIRDANSSRNSKELELDLPTEMVEENLLNEIKSPNIIEDKQEVEMGNLSRANAIKKYVNISEENQDTDEEITNLKRTNALKKRLLIDDSNDKVNNTPFYDESNHEIVFENSLEEYLENQEFSEISAGKLRVKKENYKLTKENEIEGGPFLQADFGRKRKSGVNNYTNTNLNLEEAFTTEEDIEEMTVIEDVVEQMNLLKIENETQTNESTKEAIGKDEPQKKISLPKIDFRSRFDFIFGKKISDEETEEEIIPEISNISNLLFKSNVEESGTLQEVPTVGNLLFKSNVLDVFLNLSEEKELTELHQMIKDSEASMMTDELLADVLFAVFSLMGQEESSTWGLCLPLEENGSSSAFVTMGQVKTYLKEAFQISSEKMEDIVADVKKRQVADVTLHLKVLEAKELRPKTVKGGSNPYATISIPNSRESCRTRTEHETLSPKWNQDFTLSVKNLNKDVIVVKVWHGFDAKISDHLSEVKDLQSLQLLLKNVTAKAHKQEEYLLGSFQIPIKQIKEQGIDGWYPLEKVTPKEEMKQRGVVHIKGEVSAAKSKKNYGERRSFDALLARFVYHHIKTLTNNNAEEETFQIPWSGQLSPEAVATLAQHSIILGLSGPLQHFSWWIVGSRVPSADVGWQLNQLQKVQSHMSSKAYSETDLENLAESFYNWVKYALYKLRHLRASFPSSSGIHAKHQFASLLRICVNLQSHAESKSLLQTKNQGDLMEQVHKAVNDYAKEWWTNLVEEQLRGVIKPEEQLKRVVKITEETFKFLEEVATFYSPSLLSEAKIPYFREMFMMLTSRLNPCIRPPLMNIYSYFSLHQDSHQEKTDNGNDNMAQSFVFEHGSQMWTLYVNLGRIHKLGNDLPENVRGDSGIHEYHKWFNKAVRRWVDLARQRALSMIEKAVELDNFESIDEYCNFSSSATDVIGIFTEIQIWWKYLCWPDPENSMVLLAKILEDICSYGMTYADLLKNKVERMFSDNPNSHQLALSKQICTGLNNIERVRNELSSLPDIFGVAILSEKIRVSLTGGDEVANRFITNVNALIDSSAENMEAKVIEFIELVIEKMSEGINNAVIQAAEASSHKPLLGDILDPSLRVIHKNMSDSNFKRFLFRLWEVLIELFRATVTRNTDKRKASYFNGVFSIVEESLKFFSPSDGVGLTMEEAKTEEYMELQELLQCMRLSSEHLIAKYYKERLDEQNLLNNAGKAELVVRAYFTRAGKLTVEVLMAKDMQLHHESGSLSTLASQFSNQSQYVDAYVKINMVPTDWFPNVHEARTKTLKKSDPAVFEETFDFEVGKEESGVENGFILFTLKDHNIGRSNTLIGEALIPLKNLPCVDSGLDHGVQNRYLKVTVPGMETGYQSLTALKLRTSDRVATAFLKKNNPRISVDNKYKLVVSPASDDEKPKSRSPRILHKIFTGNRNEH